MPPLEPGEIFRDARGDEYRVRSILGEGGMAIVYEVDHPRTAIRRAIKVVKFPEDADPKTREELRRCFARERRMMEEVWQLRHPNIAEICDHGMTADGEPYLVLEALAGETLSAYLRHVGPLSWEQARHIATQIGDPLVAIHSLGIVHRDLSTRNVFVLKPGQPGEPVRIKLIDFGVAKYSGLTLHPGVYGSPGYMAPEQAAGRAVIDVRADQFALGSVLYELLTGTPAFATASQGVEEILEHVQRADLGERIDQLLIPERAREALRRALNKTPGARFPRTQEFVAELRSDDMSDPARRLPRAVAEAAAETAWTATAQAARRDQPVSGSGGTSGKWSGELPESPSGRYYVALLLGLCFCGAVGFGLGGRWSRQPHLLSAGSDLAGEAADAGVDGNLAEAGIMLPDLALPRDLALPAYPDLLLPVQSVVKVTPPVVSPPPRDTTFVQPPRLVWSVRATRWEGIGSLADANLAQKVVLTCLQREHVLPAAAAKLVLIRTREAAEYTLSNKSGFVAEAGAFPRIESCVTSALSRTPIPLTPAEIHIRAESSP